MEPAQRLVGVQVSFFDLRVLLKDLDAEGFHDVLRLTSSV